MAGRALRPLVIDLALFRCIRWRHLWKIVSFRADRSPIAFLSVWHICCGYRAGKNYTEQ